MSQRILFKLAMESQGFAVPAQGSAEYSRFVASELDRWVRVIKVAGIKEE